MSVEQFFAFARERHGIYLKRMAGVPAPWTQDPILQKYKFTNVFRELDATTVWFREHVRDPLRNSPDVLLATVLFRWFNSIRTGEAIFSQLNFEKQTAWERRGRLLTHHDMLGWCSELRAVIRAHCAGGPIVNGAYIIKGTDGMDKLSGVLDAFYQFMSTTQPTDIVPCKTLAHWKQVADELRHRPIKMEDAWDWMRQFPYQGRFTAYEIVCDLRYTALLERAPDINTWANAGPGAIRGLARLHDRFVPNEEKPSRLAAEARVSNEQMLEEMCELLVHAHSNHYWPQKWPAWEMREVEHTLCEWDKYERARLGQGKPKQLFRNAA